jgi:hypothetical protein
MPDKLCLKGSFCVNLKTSLKKNMTGRDKGKRKKTFTDRRKGNEEKREQFLLVYLSRLRMFSIHKHNLYPEHHYISLFIVV